MYNYDIEGIRRKVNKEGVENTLKDLTSPNLPVTAIESLTRDHILVGGFPNVTLICSLA